MKRSSGILLPISSLPSPYGIGTFGKAAYEFADFLKASGQGYWQVLPMGPLSYGDSPYQSFSAFAGNPYFIDIDLLAEMGLLEIQDTFKLNFDGDESKIDYEKIYNSRFKILKKAYGNFLKDTDDAGGYKKEMEEFEGENHRWVFDYGIFMTVKGIFNNDPWNLWPDLLIKKRDPEQMGFYWNTYNEDIHFWVFVQYLFFRQWSMLKKYVNELGIKIIGDIPIYVAMDSVDVWANPQLFCLDENQNPSLVAGCPPDYFSEDGQLWGNPIYNWAVHKEEEYGWWFSRLNSSFNLFDVLRIDHFRGFESFYAIPFGDRDGKNGKWVQGPGLEFIKAVKNHFPQADIIAEDLGLMTEAVKKLLCDSGFPGMKVLQFAFETGESSDYLPHKYDKNCVVYTGTHDNTTLSAFLCEIDEKNLIFAKDYLRLSEEEGYTWGFIRGAYSSTANLAVIPMQDFLGLGKEARMNEPSTLGGNWQWRLAKTALTPKLSDKILSLTKLYER